MGVYFSPEQKAKIISAVKDEGMAIPDAAKTYSVAEVTIRKWLRKQVHNAHTSSTELSRLKQENQLLKELIGEIMLKARLNKKNPLMGA